MPLCYQQLVERAVMVLAADGRLVALFVVGSVGRGEADASSDLDLLAAAADETVAGDCAVAARTGPTRAIELTVVVAAHEQASGQPVRYPARFVDTVAEADAWFESTGRGMALSCRGLSFSPQRARPWSTTKGI